jgi:hypothetical protein
MQRAFEEGLDDTTLAAMEQELRDHRSTAASKRLLRQVIDARPLARRHESGGGGHEGRRSVARSKSAVSEGDGLSKLRVSELAVEFGISSDEVIEMLRSMEVFVLAPSSLLTDEQVSRLRVRWEREKRRRVARAAAKSIVPTSPARPPNARDTSRNVVRITSGSAGGRTQHVEVGPRTDILRDLIGIEAERLARWGLAPGMPPEIEETVFAAWEARLTSREDVHGRCIERLQQDRRWLVEHRQAGR